MSKRGRQQSHRGHQERNQGQERSQGQLGGGRRQSSDRTTWQSNDRGQEPQAGWNDGGIGGGDNRPRRMSGDDTRFNRREGYSGDWDTDDGRATYGSESREFQREEVDPQRRRDFGGQNEGDQYGPSPSRYLGRYEEQGDFGRGADQGRYGGPGYRSQGNYGPDRYGQGRYEQYEQGNYGQGNYGHRGSARSSYSGGHSGQGDYGRQESRQGGSFGSGASARGYREGSSWSGHAGRGPKGYQRSDERIREDVSDSLTDDPEVDASEITVEARDGEVTLTGTVQTREEKRAAEACVEEVSGVREVINQLRVSRTGSSGESSTSSGSGGTSGRSQAKSSRGNSES